MSTYRVDPHQPQNVYRGEQYIGVMFTAEDAALVVEALNRREWMEVIAHGEAQLRAAWQLAQDPVALGTSGHLSCGYCVTDGRTFCPLHGWTS